MTVSQPIAVPAGALEAYEALRKAVIERLPRPAGLATLRFHGLLQGLLLLVATEDSVRTPVSRRDPVDPPRPDNEFVRLLANLVLSTHSEEFAHVY